MKRILISLIVVLLLTLLVGGGLYYFRDASWNDVYSDDVLEMLVEDFNSEVELSVERITTRDDEVFVYLDQEGKQYLGGLEVLTLDSDLGIISEDIDYVLRGKNLYLSLEIKLESKSVLDDMLCSYLSGKYCDRFVYWGDWSLNSVTDYDE